MRQMRTKLVAQNVVRRSDGSPEPFIGLESIQSRTGRLESEDLPIKQAEDSLVHCQGDVLFGKLRPYLAKSFLAHKSGTGTGEMWVLRPNRMWLDSRFLFYTTLSRPWLEWAEMGSYGTKMPRASWETMGEYRMWVPPLEEQRRIADFLDAETRRIDRLASASSQQEELARERFVEWLRVQTTNAPGEPAEVTGVPWMPEIARSWILHKVGRAFRTGSGTTPRSTNDEYFGPGIPWLNTGDLTDGPIREIKRSVTRQALQDYSSLRSFGPGSVVIAMYGATIGRMGMLQETACTNQACCVLYEPTSVDPSFAFYWFLAHRESIMTLASGGGQPNISQDLVRSLRIPAPSLGKQREIVSEIQSYEDRMVGQRQLLARRRELLAERRQALITAAVTGEFDVTTGRGVDLS